MEIHTVLNFNDWSYQEFIDFRRAFRTGRVVQALEIVLPCIVSWDLEKSPTYEVLEELPTSTIFDITASVMEVTGQVMTEITFDEVEIDLDRWKGRDYDRYVELGQKDDLTPAEVHELESLLRQVAVIDGGFELDSGVTAVEGWKIGRAITPEIEKFFRRKKSRR